MKPVTATVEALTAPESRSKSAARRGTSHPPGRRYVRTGPARIFPVSKDVEAVGRVAGGKHLDMVLTQLGFKGNAEFARLTETSEGSISKYRNGKATPTSTSLDKIVSVIVTLADARGLYFDPVEFYVRFGLITREALQQEPVDEIFIELISLDHEAAKVSDFEHQLLREQIGALMDLTRRRLKAARAERRQAAG